MTALTKPQRVALQLARDDHVLLVRRPGTIGSLDTRDGVRLSVCMRLLRQDLLKLDIGHGEDNAHGFILTEKGRALLESEAEKA